jgi:hypothetical protein
MRSRYDVRIPGWWIIGTEIIRGRVTVRSCTSAEYPVPAIPSHDERSAGAQLRVKSRTAVPRWRSSPATGSVASTMPDGEPSMPATVKPCSSRR